MLTRKTCIVFNSDMEALNTAIKIAGSQQALAAKLGGNQTRVSEWKRRGKVADGAVLDVAKAVDFAVTPHQLRPDLYPHPDDGLPQEMRCVTSKTDEEPVTSKTLEEPVT